MKDYDPFKLILQLYIVLFSQSVEFVSIFKKSNIWPALMKKRPLRIICLRQTTVNTLNNN